MSRIGKQPIPVPDGVTVAIEPLEVDTIAVPIPPRTFGTSPAPT